jgi:branched-chain amino acid transport system substrate-binding protein
MRKKVTSIMLGLAMAASLTACGSSGSATSTTTTAAAGEAAQTEASGDFKGQVTVGVIAPVSGSAAMVGDTDVKGVKLAVKQINEAGGIDGYEIVLDVQDDEQDPTTAVSAINNIISKGEAKAVIGSVNSSCTLAVMTVTEPNQMPLITPNASGITITDPQYHYIGRLQASDRLMAKAITEYAINELGYTKIAVMYQNDDFGTGGLTVVQDTLKEAGLEPVAVEAFEPSATDMNSQLVNVKAADPEALIMWTMYTPAAAIATQAHQLGITADLMGGGGLTNAKLYELAGEDAIGILNTQTYLSNNEAASDAAKAFTAAYEAEYGETPDSNAAMAYDSMMVMAEGLKAAAPEFNPDDIMAGVKSVKDYDLASGCITMDENGDANRDILIVRLSGAEDGKPTYEVVK